MFSADNYKIIDELSAIAEKNDKIKAEYYEKYDVKRGLRNNNGTGVLVGLTGVGSVDGYTLDNGKKIPSEGKLSYRGIDIYDIVKGFQSEGRFGFEEVCYLLLFGKLPDKNKLNDFNELLTSCRNLPNGFTEDMILKAPSKDIMNKLERSILVSYSYDTNPDDISIKNVLRQSIELISQVPSMIAYGYQAKAHYYDNKSLYLHSPKEEYCIAQNILHMIRPDNKFTKIEAELLDLILVLHAEHGGGNNSTFAARVVTSTGTDTYSAIAAAVGSLKGPKHGGANIMVMKMLENIKENLKDWGNKDEIYTYIKKILNKQAFDGSGLVYGMGHAIYTLSDPRELLLKKKALKLAEQKNRLDEFYLYENIENITKAIFEDGEKHIKICANVDFYSGFVYDMLNIPYELYTPLFATARVVGWCAHRIEHLVSEQKIIRPAYQSIIEPDEYMFLNDR